MCVNVDDPSPLVHEGVHHFQEPDDEFLSLPFFAVDHVFQVLVKDEGKRGLSEVFR